MNNGIYCFLAAPCDIIGLPHELRQKLTVSIQDWRLQMQDTYSINFDLNVNKCLPASIRETP